MKRSHFAFALAFCSLALPLTAHAQDDADAAAEARRQYQAGTQAYAAKRYNEAALAFEAAAAYKANAVTLYTAALSWDYANAPERAADAYSRALDAQGLTPQQQSTAKERLGALEKTMGILTVTGPDGFKVQLDNLTATTVPARLHASAGVHTLVVRGTSGSPEKRDVTVELGQATAVDVTPKAETPKAPPPKAPEAKVVTVEVEGPPRLSWKKAVGFCALGLGVMSGVGAIVLGLSAQDAGDAYNANPSRQALDHANGLATWTTVAWITGGVLVAAGITFVLLPDKPASKQADQPPKPSNPEAPPAEPALSLAPSLGGASLRGTF